MFSIFGIKETCMQHVSHTYRDTHEKRPRQAWWNTDNTVHCSNPCRQYGFSSAAAARWQSNCKSTLPSTLIRDPACMRPVSLLWRQWLKNHVKPLFHITVINNELSWWSNVSHPLLKADNDISKATAPHTCIATGCILSKIIINCIKKTDKTDNVRKT